MLVATSTTTDENRHHPVIPSPSREGRGIWGGGGDAPPQMLRRCGWLSMTFSEQEIGLTLPNPRDNMVNHRGLDPLLSSQRERPGTEVLLEAA
jgi:hypothetical protein